MITARDSAVLAFDPWSGDWDSDAVTMRDTFVRARVAAQCSLCFGTIKPGDRVRAQTRRSRQMRKVMTFKFCPLCCEAMLDSAGDYRRLERRYALGRRRAQRQHAEGETSSV